MIAFAASRPSLTTSHQAVGHARLELQPDHPAAPAALDRGAEVADQVLGFLLDLDVAVAEDAEGAAAQHLVVAGTDNRSCAGSASRARCSGDSSPGMRMKRGSATGSMISSRTGWRLPLRELEDQRKAAVGDERERVRRVDRLRRQHREDLLAEMLVEPGSRRLRRAARRRRRMTPASASAACRSSHTSCWLVTSRSASAVDRGQLLAGGQAVDRPLLDPERLVRLEAGDADHEEFVEVAGRDRQEAQPLEQRVGGVAGFLEHAAVERQPAQLAVEIARLRLRLFGGRGSRPRPRRGRPSTCRTWYGCGRACPLHVAELKQSLVTMM